MITDSASFYSIFPNVMEGSRIDFVFHHPELETVREFRRSSVVKLGSYITTPEYGLSVSGLAEGGVGFINVQHINFNGEIIFDPPTFIEDCSEHDLLKEGDILIARTGHTLGKTTYINKDFFGYAFGSFCIRFSMLSENDFRGEFVVRFLNSNMGQLQIFMLKSGSGKYNINSDQIRDICIPIIKPTYQDNIIKIVRNIKSEAVTLRNRAKDTQILAENMMLQELGIPIPPPISPNYFFKTGTEKQTLYFLISPDDVTDRIHYLFFHPRYQVLESLNNRCRTIPLRSNEVCREPIIRGEQPEYDETGAKIVLKTVDLKNGYIDYDNALRVSEDFFENHPNAQVHKGDILIASTGYVSMGKVDVYDREEPAMVDGHISIIRVKDEYDPYFIAYFLRSHLGQLQFEKWFTGSSGQIELQPGDLGNFRVPESIEGGVPLSEQERIAELVKRELDLARQLERQAEAKWQEAKDRFEEMIFPGTDRAYPNHPFHSLIT